MNNNNNLLIGSDLEKSLAQDSLAFTLANGNSMYPFIKDHTKILLSKPKDIKVLDTILFKNNNHYILHRVVGINGNEYIVMGDNSDKKEYLKADDILGVLVGYYIKNQYIEISDILNSKYYNLSLKMKPLIKIKNMIKSLVSVNYR